MGQIIGNKPLPLRGNLRAIQQGGALANTVLALNQYMLISSTNSMTNQGSGNFDKYIVGDGIKTCSELTLYSIEDPNKSGIIDFLDGLRVDLGDINLSDKNTDLETYLNALPYVKYNTDSQNLNSQSKVNARINIDSDNLVTGYYVSTDIDATHPAGFYAESTHETILATAPYVARKLYLDVSTNMLYHAAGGTLSAVAGQPITGATYDSTNQILTLSFNGGISVNVPFQLPTFVAGKGISINNNTIAQNYDVVSEDWMEEYLGDDTQSDDGIIRYVYED